jgi:hemerythrin-like domain-containing protein
MKPIGPLMIEHRLIERFISILERTLKDMEKSHKVDIYFMYAAVDFFRAYADRTHHGKEEDILFRDLDTKKLAPDHKKIMGELIEEHIHARKTVGNLLAANEDYRKGESGALEKVLSQVRELVSFYPAHIEKEDKHFFLPIMNYFTQEEQDAMLVEFYEFDRNMIHEKYRKVVEQYTK